MQKKRRSSPAGNHEKCRSVPAGVHVQEQTLRHCSRSAWQRSLVLQEQLLGTTSTQTRRNNNPGSAENCLPKKRLSVLRKTTGLTHLSTHCLFFFFNPQSVQCPERFHAAGSEEVTSHEPLEPFSARMRLQAGCKRVRRTEEGALGSASSPGPSAES